MEEQKPVIEGQLKEKKGGRCSLFKKWKSRYFTLSGDKLTYKDTVSTIFEIVHYLQLHTIISVGYSEKKLV